MGLRGPIARPVFSSRSMTPFVNKATRRLAEGAGPHLVREFEPGPLVRVRPEHLAKGKSSKVSTSSG